MRTLDALSVAVSLVAIAMLGGTTSLSAAEESYTRCGQRDNPDTEQPEHRFQSEGVCITGGLYHEGWLRYGCTEQNRHQSTAC